MHDPIVPLRIIEMYLRQMSIIRLVDGLLPCHLEMNIAPAPLLCPRRPLPGLRERRARSEAAQQTQDRPGSDRGSARQYTR